MATPCWNSWGCPEEQLSGGLPVQVYGLLGISGEELQLQSFVDQKEGDDLYLLWDRKHKRESQSFPINMPIENNPAAIGGQTIDSTFYMFVKMGGLMKMTKR